MFCLSSFKAQDNYGIYLKSDNKGSRQQVTKVSCKNNLKCDFIDDCVGNPDKQKQMKL